MESNSTHFYEFLKNMDPDIIFEVHEPIILNAKHQIGFYFYGNNEVNTSNFLKDIIKKYADINIHLIFIFEYQWLENEEIIRSRVKALFGKFSSIHGRKTKVVRIDKQIAEPFLNQNHLQGYVSSKFKYGLYLQDELVAVATFSAGRKMNNRPEGFRSFELIRFANKLNYRVIGGLSKLIYAFAKNHNVGNMMTYVDACWTDGANFEKLGFENKGYFHPFSRSQNVPNSDEIGKCGSIKLIKEFSDFKI